MLKKISLLATGIVFAATMMFNVQTIFRSDHSSMTLLVLENIATADGEHEVGATFDNRKDRQSETMGGELCYYQCLDWAPYSCTYLHNYELDCNHM